MNCELDGCCVWIRLFLCSMYGEVTGESLEAQSAMVAEWIDSVCVSIVDLDFIVSRLEMNSCDMIWFLFGIPFVYSLIQGDVVTLRAY